MLQKLMPGSVPAVPELIELQSTSDCEFAQCRYWGSR